jgi:TolB-like protein
VSRNEVMRFRDGGGTTADIAKALHADAVMETTVFRDGDRMRINAQLVEPVSLRYVWSQTYERDVKDVLAAQRELVDAIAADVAGTLGGTTVAARSPKEPAP